MANLHINRTKTALLCMDMHKFIVDRVPKDRQPNLVTNVKRVLDAARQAGVQVIYVAVGRRSGFTSARNKFTSSVRVPTDPAEMAEPTTIVEPLAPAENDRLCANHASTPSMVSNSSRGWEPEISILSSSRMWPQTSLSSRPRDMQWTPTTG